MGELRSKDTGDVEGRGGRMYLQVTRVGMGRWLYTFHHHKVYNEMSRVYFILHIYPAVVLCCPAWVYWNAALPPAPNAYAEFAPFLTFSALPLLLLLPPPPSPLFLLPMLSLPLPSPSPSPPLPLLLLPMLNLPPHPPTPCRFVPKVPFKGGLVIHQFPAPPTKC